MGATGCTTAIQVRIYIAYMYNNIIMIDLSLKFSHRTHLRSAASAESISLGRRLSGHRCGSAAQSGVRAPQLCGCT